MRFLRDSGRWIRRFRRGRGAILAALVITVVGIPVVGGEAANTGVVSAMITLGQARLNYGASNSDVTGGQKLLILNTGGGGTLNWTATGVQSWISVVPAAGIDSEYITVMVDPTGFGPGTYTGTVTVADPGALNSPQTVEVFLKVYATGTTAAPFGSFATPVDGSTVQSSVPVTGWALDDLGDGEGRRRQHRRHRQPIFHDLQPRFFHSGRADEFHRRVTLVVTRRL